MMNRCDDVETRMQTKRQQQQLLPKLVAEESRALESTGLATVVAEGSSTVCWHDVHLLIQIDNRLFGSNIIQLITG